MIENIKEVADLVLINANVITMDEKDTRARAIAVKGDRISFVGSDEEVKQLISKETRVMDLKGKTVLPGFIDTHVHFLQTGLGLIRGVDLWEVRSVKEILDKVAAFKERIPKGELIRGIRLDESRIHEKRFPTRWELDEVAPDHYVIISNVEGHSCSVNTKTLKCLNLPGEAKGVDKDPKTGKPTGVLRDPAVFSADRLSDELDSDEICKKAIKAAAEEATRVGLTTVHAMEGTRGINLLLGQAKNLPARIKLFEFAETADDVDKIIKRHMPDIGVKIIIDGAFGAHTGALFEPYTDDPSTKGTLIFTDEELNKMVLKAHKAGLQLAIHAVGDAALEQLLDAYENLLKNHPKVDHRHRIEHFELPTKDQIKRTAELEVTLAMQPQHMYLFNYKEFIGDRVERGHPYRAILEKDILVAGGSDSLVAPMDTLFCIHCLVNMPYPGQRIGVKDAVKINTINGAKMGFEEKEKGTIEVGKLADLVVLSDDFYAAKPDNIQDIRVLLTIVGGKIVYQKSE